MAWELQTDMVALIRPSIEAYLEEHDAPETEAARILTYQRTEGETDIAKLEAAQELAEKEVDAFGLDWAVATLSQHAESVATTSNGAWDVWLDSGGWCTVPFCTENA